MPKEYVVKINDMSFQHENGVTVFHDVTMTFARGLITAILGPSGTGKTTLLRLIGGQLRQSSGEINVFGHQINDLPQKELYLLRKKMAMLFQSAGLFTHLNVFENVAFALREHTDLSESIINTLVLMKLQMVGLRGAQHLMPAELSGGMARRVALARAIALDPELILYDEPFTGQDPISMGVLLNLIKTLKSALNCTTIIVSHDVAETLTIADYVYVLNDKRVIKSGTPEEIMADESKTLQQFIKGLPDGPMAFHYPSVNNFETDFLKD